MTSDKANKKRGSHTHGFGAKKKHRGKGSKGGKGLGGSSKHNRSFVYAKDPGHFGKKGFTSLKERAKVINVFELAKFEGEVNLTEMGYGKLLGQGEISKPLKVKVLLCSPSAKEKVEKAGGQIITE
ncbi:MAG: uL15 family ribosomal protein [Candidatus Aenigmarchaeota archaeon]|nr:uL15 family ribosomal protein [Candidatus Aenigmarchaeota archaeon]